MKKYKSCKIKYNYCDCFDKYINFKDDLIKCKYLGCNKSYQRNLDEKLKDKFFNIWKFSNHVKNKFIFLQRKGFYPYEYIDKGKSKWNIITWKRHFYSHLSMEDIIDEDYAHEKRVCKDFEVKNLGKYHECS